MRFPFFRNRDSVKNGILISIRRTGDGFHPGLFSFENKDTEIYKELIQSLIELSFIKVAELKDELTIGQDVLIYDYFY